MDCLLDILSDDIFSFILMEWVKESELCYVDIAICDRSLREKYLRCLSNIRRSSCTVPSLNAWRSINLWRRQRNLRIESLMLELMHEDGISKILQQEIFPDSQLQQLKSLQIRCAYSAMSRDEDIAYDRTNIYDVLISLPCLEILDIDMPKDISYFQLPYDYSDGDNSRPMLKLKELIIYGPELTCGNTPAMLWLQAHAPLLQNIGIQIPASHFQQIFTMFPSAKTIKLWQARKLKHHGLILSIEHEYVEELFLSVLGLECFELRACPHLHTLHLRVETLNTTLFLHHLPSPYTNTTWKQLRKLCFGGCKFLTNEILKKLLEVCQDSLQAIEFQDCQNLSGGDYAMVVRMGKRLRSIQISYEPHERNIQLFEQTLSMKDFVQAFVQPSLSRNTTTSSSTEEISSTHAATAAADTLMDTIADDSTVSLLSSLLHATPSISNSCCSTLHFPPLQVLHLENCLGLTTKDIDTLFDATADTYTFQELSIVFTIVGEIFQYHKVMLRVLDKLTNLSIRQSPSIQQLTKLTLKFPIHRNVDERLSLFSMWEISFPVLQFLRIHGIQLVSGNMDLIMRLCPKLWDIYYFFVPPNLCLE